MKRRSVWAAVLLMAPVVASAQEGFQSPSGNIHCAHWGDELRRDIQQRSYRPPQPRGACDLDFGNAVGMTAAGAPGLLCHGDTIVDPGRPMLPYGTTWQGRGFTCTSAESGVRCVNRAGRGFEMARAQLRFF